MYEENNRIITDHISSLLFCPTKNSTNNLFDENLHKNVILSGDVMYDSYLKFLTKANHSIEDFKKSKYILATIHRRENINSSNKLSNLFKNLDKINSCYKIIMPLHPHTKKKIIEYGISSNVNFVDPLGYISILSLLKDCELVITDSGGLQKESFFAKKKCIVVRDQTEWIELIEHGSNILCKPSELYDAYNYSSKKECDFLEKIYGEGNASNIIAKSIESFFKN